MESSSDPEIEDKEENGSENMSGEDEEEQERQTRKRAHHDHNDDHDHEEHIHEDDEEGEESDDENHSKKAKMNDLLKHMSEAEKGLLTCITEELRKSVPVNGQAPHENIVIPSDFDKVRSLPIITLFEIRH